jgi:arylamine N-acetyltransferase
MATNPYAKFLGETPAWELIEETAGRLKFLLERLGPKMETAPAPGKWSPRQIVCHLADCEIVFAYRLRQALAEEHHVIQPFDQDQWATMYDACDAATALKVFSAVREWNVRLISSMTPHHLMKKLTHPERGEMHVAVVVETMAGHDLNHLAQLEALAETV